MLPTKICSNPKCKKEKNVNEFHKSKKTRDGYTPQCKACNLARDEKRRARHKDSDIYFNSLAHENWIV